MVVFVVVGVTMQVRKDNAREAALQAIGPVVLRVDKAVVLDSDPPRLSVMRGDGGREVWPLTADTVVTVETSGSMSTVRGRDPAAKAAGGVLMPGVGLFLFGNAKNKTIDNRQLFVALESARAAHVVGARPRRRSVPGSLVFAEMARA